MKWDEEARCRSSGSESESDSDCDNSKPKRNNWIYAGSTVNFTVIVNLLVYLASDLYKVESYLPA